jgi:sec-independent protein translocase protein TatA
MFGLGSQELFIIFLIAMVLFGGAKLPDLARSLGRSMSEFKKGMSDTRPGDDAPADTKKPS